MPTSTSPLHRVPSHVVAYILSHLGTVQDLGVAIRSHRIFLYAFRDAPHSIPRDIVKEQIPDNVLPFVIALLESTQVNRDDRATGTRAVLDRLAAALSDNGETAKKRLTTLSLPDLAFCSLNYATSESLTQVMTQDVKGLARSSLKFKCKLSNHKPTLDETFRITRAFLRFQILCNLFCVADSDNPLFEDDANDLRTSFYSPFSPWVNEHIMCVFSWSQKMVCAVFDQLAWQSVEWAMMPVLADMEPDETPRIQWSVSVPPSTLNHYNPNADAAAYPQHQLSSGLPVLNTVALSNHHDQWFGLLDLSDVKLREFERHPSQQFDLMITEENLVEIDGLGDIEAPLSDWTAEELERLAGAADGLQDSPTSSSFLHWFSANFGRSILGEVFDDEARDTDGNLWEVGYNLWDSVSPGTVPPPDILKTACDELRYAPSYLNTRRNNWDDETMMRSRRQRMDIYSEGGRGTWDGTFNGIHGLTEEKKAKLSAQWKNEFPGLYE